MFLGKGSDMTEIKKFTTYFVNGYIVKGDTTIMFDTGALFEPEQLPGILEGLEVSPEEIKYIVISHAHYDHCMLAKAWKELTGAKIICHEKTAEALRDGNAQGRFAYGPKCYEYDKAYYNFMEETTPPAIPTVEPDIVFGNEGLDLHQYGVAGKIIYTPGHDDSHIALILDDCTALTGDTVYDLHDVGCFTEDPRFPAGSYSLNWICTDEELIKDSARKLLEAADTFYGGHGETMDRSVIEPLV